MAEKNVQWASGDQITLTKQQDQVLDMVNDADDIHKQYASHNLRDWYTSPWQIRLTDPENTNFLAFDGVGNGTAGNVKPSAPGFFATSSGGGTHALVRNIITAWGFQRGSYVSVRCRCLIAAAVGSANRLEVKFQVHKNTINQSPAGIYSLVAESAVTNVTTLGTDVQIDETITVSGESATEMLVVGLAHRWDIAPVSGMLIDAFDFKYKLNL